MKKILVTSILNVTSLFVVVMACFIAASTAYSKTLVVVITDTASCSACQQMEPEVVKIRTAAHRVGVSIVVVKPTPSIVAKYKVIGIPTIVVVKDGTAVAKFIGFTPAETVISVFTTASAKKPFNMCGNNQPVIEEYDGPPRQHIHQKYKHHKKFHHKKHKKQDKHHTVKKHKKHKHQSHKEKNHEVKVVKHGTEVKKITTENDKSSASILLKPPAGASTWEQMKFWFKLPERLIGNIRESFRRESYE